MVLWFELPHRVAADGAQHTPPPPSTKAPSVPHTLSLLPLHVVAAAHSVDQLALHMIGVVARATLYY